uniref:Uncharacterized protein n=1 Tax=Anguilla anguilla TaxID=7936 RepID=A0A0E9RL24_ANGAN
MDLTHSLLDYVQTRVPKGICLQPSSSCLHEFRIYERMTNRSKDRVID